MEYKDYPETITSRSFDEKFKNYLRDYYTYGFKNVSFYTRYGKREETYNTDKERLNNIIGEYMEWSDNAEENGRVYITQDSQSTGINPFHRVYRFCNHKPEGSGYFFNTIAAFSWPRIELRGGFESLKGDANAVNRLKKKMNIDLIPKAISMAPKTILREKIENERERLRNIPDYNAERVNREIAEYTHDLVVDLEDELERLKNNDFDLYIDKLKQAGVNDKDILEYKKLREGDYTLTTSDLACYYQGECENKALKYNLDKMKDLGIIRQEKDNKMGNNKWSLSALTMEKLISAGENVNLDFEKHFSTFLDFFSKYFIFGEVGMFLLDRMETDESCFRFKQQYFMQSLNDFNIIDLTAAMEQNRWCCIKYKHATKDIETTMLCYPLEIRISTTTGREHLMYYDPTIRGYNALRIEFIDSIDCYKDEDVRKALNEVISLTGEEIDSDLENVRWSLKHSWGVSTPLQENGKAELTLVKIHVCYNPKTEHYILERLQQECRDGDVNAMSDTEVEFTAEVTDTVEMRPWIRSFYSRIEESEGIEKDGFSLEADVARMQEGFSRKRLKETETINKKDTEFEKVSGKIVKRLGKGKPAEEHEKLFNKIFSVQYYMLADGFVRLCSKYHKTEDELIEYSREELLSDINTRLSEEEPLRPMEAERGNDTEEYMPAEVKTLFKKDEFISEVQYDNEPRQYCWEYVFHNSEDFFNTNFYCDFVPLTELEIRWLKTILSEDHASYFLQPDEIQAIMNMLDQMAPDIKPLPMDKVVYYDRQHFPNKDAEKEKNVIGIFLDSIASKRMINICYQSRKGKDINEEFIPVFLEFSMRKNQFQAYCVSNSTDQVFILNLSRISKAEITKKSFDPKAAEKIANNDREQNYRSVIIEFYDEKNLADRILTEFSPWEKTCQFNPDSGVYTLKIFYPMTDEKELVIRLLGYGADVYIDPDCAIGSYIREHIEKQEAIFAEK